MMRPVSGIRIPSAMQSHTSSTSGCLNRPRNATKNAFWLVPSPSAVVKNVTNPCRDCHDNGNLYSVCALSGLHSGVQDCGNTGFHHPMEEDSAAKNTSSQNSSWKIFPAVPMDVNTVVIDTNSSPGPADGSRPNANTAGKIATPARTATKESPKVMIAALDSRFSFLSR